MSHSKCLNSFVTANCVPSTGLVCDTVDVLVTDTGSCTQSNVSFTRVGYLTEDASPPPVSGFTAIT
jgi:hypothetical protein